MFDLTFGNLVAWVVQVAAIGLAGVLLPLLLGVTSPRARLTYLRALLVACLVLPLLQPWVPVTAPVAATVASALSEDLASLDGPSGPAAASAAGPAVAAPSGRWPLEAILLAVYVSGVAIRLAWLGLGLLSLSRLRRSSTAAEPRPAAISSAVDLVGVDADFRVSSRVVRPVTFGLRRPVVLVPPGFLAFRPEQQTAVAVHELLHVARRDWVRTLGDELILSVFWFHPALWWLVEQIHLSVEQVVDSAVVHLVGARKPYLEALLTLAAAGPTPMLQPASAFLKHGHLAQRVALLVREASMSRLRLVASFAVALAVLVGGGMYVVQAFPLTAVVEAVAAPLPSAPISVAAPLATPPPPPPAPSKVEADQATGQQTTKPTVPPSAQTARPGAVPLPKVPPPPPPPPPRPGEKSAAYTPPPPFDPVAWDKNVQSVTARMAAAPSDPTLAYTLGTLYWERVYRDVGLTGAQKYAYLEQGFEALDSALAMKPEYVDALVYKNLLLRSQATLEADPAKQQQLIAEADKLRDQALKLKNAQNAWAAVPPNAARVGGTVKPPTKVKDVKPVYPEAATNARVQGVVIIEAVIGPDGKVQDSRVLRSIPLLDQAALDAVKQWEFTPTMLNGQAVPVVMTMTANFALADGPGDKAVAGGVAGGVVGGVPGGVAGGVAGAGSPVTQDSTWAKSIDPNAIRVGGNIRPPAKIADAKPIYPLEAQEARVQGVVILEAVIAPDGHVAGARVLRSIPMLDEAAYSAVMKWYFTPTLLNGAPVSVVMTVTVNFTLQ